MGVFRIARPFAVAFAKPLGLPGSGPITAATETIILAVMAGQSNMVGRNAPDGVDTDLADIFQYVGDAGQGDYRTLSSDITPLDHPDAFDRVGPGIEILKAIRAANPAAKIVAVPTAVGSSGILNGGWLSNATTGAGGTRFEFMLTQAAQARTAALAAYPGATIQWQFYWAQGEQDAAEERTYADYKAALSDVISRTRSRLTGAANAPWIMGSMVPEKWTPEAPAGYVASYVPINLAHVDLSVELTNVFYARGPEDPDQLNDNLHYQPASAARLFGQRMGAVPTDTVGPTVTTAASQSSAVGTTLAVTLTHDDPTLHATFSIDGGADAANFEISDRYLTPTLRWTGDGTGPAIGTYSVGVRARDGAGNYGPTKIFTVQQVSEVSPAAFFTNGERGMVWDISDASTLFQDVAGTTPVTAAGQPVGRMLDKSPNGNHWTAAANNTTRPTYQIDADGKPYLQFDGSNDVLFAATPFVQTTDAIFTAIMGLFSAPQSTTKTLLANNSTASGTPFVVPFQSEGATANLRSQIRNDGSGSIAGVPSVPAMDSTKRVLTAQFFGANASLRIRMASNRPAGGGTGGYNSTAIGTFTGPFTVTRAGLGANPGATPANFFNGRVYSGFAISRGVSDGEVRSGENWIASRMGVTLP